MKRNTARKLTAYAANLAAAVILIGAGYLALRRIFPDAVSSNEIAVYLQAILDRDKDYIEKNSNYLLDEYNKLSGLAGEVKIYRQSRFFWDNFWVELADGGIYSIEAVRKGKRAFITVFQAVDEKFSRVSLPKVFQPFTLVSHET